MSMATLIAHTGPHPSLGGEPGAWWAAMQTPSLPPRPHWLDDWAIEKIGRAPSEVYKTAARGDLQPTVARQWDEGVDAAASRLHTALSAAFTEALERVARQAGVHVMAWCKDNAHRERLETHALTEVPLAASLISVTAGRTLWQAAHVDFEAVVAAQAERLRAKAEQLGDEHDKEIAALASSLFGATLTAAVMDRAGLVRDVESQFFETARAVPSIGLPKSVSGRITRSIEVAMPQGSMGRVLNRALSSLDIDDVPQAAKGFVEAVSRGRVAVSTTRRFVWGKHGLSDSPFPPHRDEADGQTETDLVGSWFPGDHAGCRCGWKIETVIVTLT